MKKQRIYDINTDTKEKIKKRIRSYEANMIHANKIEISYYRLKIKEDNELLKRIKRNRIEFRFENDLNTVKSESPIDQYIRTKIRESNYNGFIEKNKANKEIDKIDSISYLLASERKI